MLLWVGKHPETAQRAFLCGYEHNERVRGRAAHAVGTLPLL
jgi:hypothetical protein